MFISLSLRLFIAVQELKYKQLTVRALKLQSEINAGNLQDCKVTEFTPKVLGTKSFSRQWQGWVDISSQVMQSWELVGLTCVVE